MRNIWKENFQPNTKLNLSKRWILYYVYAGCWIWEMSKNCVLYTIARDASTTDSVQNGTKIMIWCWIIFMQQCFVLCPPASRIYILHVFDSNPTYARTPLCPGTAAGKLIFNSTISTLSTIHRVRSKAILFVCRCYCVAVYYIFIYYTPKLNKII